MKLSYNVRGPFTSAFLRIAVFLLALLRAGSLGAEEQAGTIGSLIIPPAQIFSCGSGFTFTSFSVSIHGNLVGFQSPAGQEHIGWGTPRSGYQICYSVSGVGELSVHDFGGVEAGWGTAVSTSQPNGPNTFPLEITRTSSDGRIQVLRRITGNSFVGPVPLVSGKPNATYDNINGNTQGCDVLGECGNCTNRTVHIVTRVTNLSAGSLTDIKYIELIDFDVDDGPLNDIHDHTNDAVTARQINGILMQSLILDPNFAEVDNFGGFGTPVSCAGAITPITTPTAAGDFEGAIRQDIGTVGAGSNTGNNFRIHVRRF